MAVLAFWKNCYQFAPITRSAERLMSRLGFGLLLILVCASGCAAVSAASPFGVPAQWEPDAK